MFHRHRARSTYACNNDPQQREQYINEINQEGDFLLQQCNSIIEQQSAVDNDILQAINPHNNTPSSAEMQSRQTGTLKFFDEAKKYGFIIMDSDGSDIFVHQDDLNKAGLTKEFLRTAKQGNTIRLIRSHLLAGCRTFS
jgi:hypothetical protein